MASTPEHLRPLYPDQIKMVLSGGRILTHTNAMWVIRKVPLTPVVDAKDSRRIMEAGMPIWDLQSKLAPLANTATGRRQFAKGSYRNIRYLAVNVPGRYQPPPNSPIASHLKSDYPNVDVERRLLTAAVQLRPSLARKGKNALQSAIESVTEMLDPESLPLADYELDYDLIDRIMRESGCVELGTDTFGRSEFNLARAWWNFGENPSIPMMVHADHIHFFKTTRAAKTARLLEDRAKELGEAVECADWNIPDSYAVTYASVASLELPFIEHDMTSAQWVVELFNTGARAVSISGQVEPAKITRKELERKKKTYAHEVEELYSQRQMTKAEQDEKLGALEEMEAIYATGGGQPTLTNASIVVALDGQVGDVSRELPESVTTTLGSLLGRQQAAFVETQLGSPIQAAPQRHDLPASSVAMSGIVNLSTVGDKDGALLGFTEHDRQPAYVHPMGASVGDAEPFLVVLGATGSGKSVPANSLLPARISPRAINGFLELANAEVGDEVIGRGGEPCEVTWASPIKLEKRSYRLTFDTKQHSDAGWDHQWIVQPVGVKRSPKPERIKHQANLLRGVAHNVKTGATITSAELLEFLLANNIRTWKTPEQVAASLDMVDVRPPHPAFSEQYETREALWGLADRITHRFLARAELEPGEMVMSTGEIITSGDKFSIRVPKPAQFPHQNLPVDPYMLGLSLSGYFTAEELAERSSGEGPCSSRLLDSANRSLTLARKERIPRRYLRASVDQRQRLLDGLTDALGTNDGEFSRLLSRPAYGLTEDVLELARSLGIKCWVEDTSIWLNKDSRLDDSGFNKKLFIKTIEPIDPVPMRCISVDSPDATYLIKGFIPTSNTMALMHLARQWAKWPTRRGELTPIVMVDPKAGQDFSKPVLAMGGQVYSLDDLQKSDGALDPIRVMGDKSEAIQVASRLLSGINPWGQGQRQGYEVAIISALRYGVEQGGSCIIEALQIADAYQPLPEGLLDPIIDLAKSDPMARSIIGFEPGGTPLRQMQGLSLIMAGKTSIPLPSPGVPWDQTGIMERVGTWVLRMMTYGAASAVAYRDGVVILDEAWQFLTGPDGAFEVQRLARLARSMQFLPVLASQRVSDFIDANLTGGISRGIILPLEAGTGVIDKQGNKDDGQAGLALDLFRIERSPRYLNRLAAKAKREGSDEPNWGSMRALKAVVGPGHPKFDPQKPDKEQVIRGSIGLYVDLTGRVVPTEIVIPPSFLQQISTTSGDVIAREKAEAEEQAKRAQEALLMS